MYFPLFYDPTFFLLIPAFIIAIYAQYKVKATFIKYNKQYASKGLTGSQVARELLQKQGIKDVAVREIAGNLSDHYDPRKKVLNLSKSVYSSSSLAAIGVAAHETGHAIQDATGYKLLAIRASLVPAANIGSSWGLPLAIFGFFLRSEFMIGLGLVIFMGALLFHLVTLPVEFNASNRAIDLLAKGGYLLNHELNGARKVLRAAAFTYVAATLVALANLLRIFMFFGMSRDD